MPNRSAYGSTRLLEITLSSWVGEGPYVCLLESLVRHSLDAGDISPKLFSKWPRAASSDWDVSYNSGDSFYLRAITILITSDVG